MGTRTYSRRSASGERIPTALGRRTGRFTGEPALESTNIPRGWQGRDGDVGIVKQILNPREGGIIAGITPQNYERPGRNPYFSFELAQGEEEFTIPLSRNENASWRELTNEADSIISLIQEAVGEEGNVTIGSNGDLYIDSVSNGFSLFFPQSQGVPSITRFNEDRSTQTSERVSLGTGGIQKLISALEQATNTTVARAVREPRDRSQDVDAAYATVWGEVRKAEAVARSLANRIAQVNDPAVRSKMAGQYADYYQRVQRNAGQLQAELRLFRRENENALPRGFAFQNGEIVGTRANGSMVPVVADLPTPQAIREQYGIE